MNTLIVIALLLMAAWFIFCVYVSILSIGKPRLPFTARDSARGAVVFLAMIGVLIAAALALARS